MVPPHAPRLGPARISASLALCLLILALMAGWWWMQAHPVPVAGAADARLQCMSYAPFRQPGRTPFLKSTMVSEDELRTDLSILAPRTACVRTYSVMQGLDAVPRVAQSLGMKTLMGIWLGRDREANEAEIRKGIEVAKANPEAVTAIVVGNEVLLRRELPMKEISDILDRVRAEVKQPVTYADVWEFWTENKELAGHVSFATIHILPYWEDHPVSIGASIHHIVDIAENMRKELGGLDILIGETGWPSEGRSRRDAVPGRVNQARFVREFTNAAAEHKLRYNFIEAFDQPWKRDLEGAMGGAWGVFNSEGKAKFPATGPVSESANGWQGGVGIGAGAVLGVVISVLGFWLSGGAGPGALLAWTAAAGFGGAMGAALAVQLRHLVVWNRFFSEWIVSGAYTVVAVVLALLTLVLCTGRMASRTPRSHSRFDSDRIDVPAFASLRMFRSEARWVGRLNVSPTERWMAVLSSIRFAWLAGLAGFALLHVFDSRYRGFPFALHLMAVASFAWLSVAGYRFNRIGREEWALALVAIIGAVVRLFMEGPFVNAESRWFWLLVILCVMLMIGWRLRSPKYASYEDGADAG